MRFLDSLERINILVGRTVAWLTLVMVLTTFIIVVMRYLFVQRVESGYRNR